MTLKLAATESPPSLGGRPWRIALLRLALCVLLPLHGLAQSPEWRLAGIEVEGLRALAPERIRSMSGLSLGETVRLEDLEAAAARLFESGFFRSVSFRYRYQGPDLTAIFLVEEGDVEIPVVFDNFVWFSDEEIRRAVRSQIPRFDGSAVPGPDSVAAIEGALRLLMHRGGIRTQIQSETPTDPDTGRPTAMVFWADADLPICAIRISAAHSVPNDLLAERTRPLAGQNYSRRRVLAFAEQNVLPLFQNAGRLRAEFQTPSAELFENDTCLGGVLVTLPLIEGYVYSWDRAEWDGSSLFTDAELSEKLGMNRGEIADLEKIESGLRAVREAYAAKGLDGIALEVSPVFDDDRQTVAYRIFIEEDP